MDAHMVELVYTPGPKGRVRATSTTAQALSTSGALTSRGMPPPEQPTSQHQG